MEARTAGSGLRPLGVGEILDAAFRLYRARFRTLSLCVLVPVVPFTILQVLVMALLFEDAFDPTTDSVSAADGAQLAGLGATALLSLPAVAACTHVVAAAHLGEDVDWPDALRYALARCALLLAALIATLAFTFAGLVALLVPGIYILVRLAVVTPALLVENLGPGAALRRSWRLVGGRWWPAAGVLLVTLVLALLVGGLIQGLLLAPLQDTDGEIFGAVLTGLGQILASLFTLPLQAAVIAILYFDLRLRKEGPVEGPVDDEPDATFGGFAPPRPSDSDPRRA